MTRIRTNRKPMGDCTKEPDSYAKDLADKSRKLHAASNRPRKEWKRQDYERFKNEFRALIKYVNTYLIDSEAYSRLITTKGKYSGKGQGVGI